MEILIKQIKKAAFNIRLKREINKANRLHKQTKYKYLVILWKGKPKAIPKQRIRDLIRKRKIRATIQHIEKYALYKTV